MSLFKCVNIFPTLKKSKIHFLRRIKIGNWKRLPVYQALTPGNPLQNALLPGVGVWRGGVVVVVMRRELSKGGETQGEGGTAL